MPCNPRADRGYSPDTGTTPSWALTPNVRHLKPGANGRYKNALKEFQSFIECKQLPEIYLPRPNCPGFKLAPVEVLRRFARYFAKGKTGKVMEEPRIHTTCQKVSDLLGAIEVLTSEAHTDEAVADIYDYVKHNLVNEGLVSSKSKRRFDFNRDDIEQTQDVIWLQLDPHTNSECKVRSGRFINFENAMLYLFQTYGCRISAMLPKAQTEANTSIEELQAVLKRGEEVSESKSERTSKPRLPLSNHAHVGEKITGLRYKDLRVLLMRKHRGSDEVEPVVTLAQRYFKGNDNTRDDALVAWGALRANILRDYVFFVLSFAFAEKAFKKFSDPRSLLQHKMNKNLECEECEWRDEVKDLHIFRPYIDSPKPYTQFQWDTGLQLATKQAGYTETVTVHRIRQATTQAVNATGITPAQHKHLFGQTITTFQKQYMNEHTSVDAQGIANGDTLRPDIAVKLRSATRSMCRGLPTVLTSAQREAALKDDPRVVELEDRWNDLVASGDTKERMRAYDQLKNRRRRVLKDRLQLEQKRYHAEQLATYGDDTLPAGSISQQRWSRLMRLQPEHARVAGALANDNPLDIEARIALLDDLVVLARQEEPFVDLCIHTRFRGKLAKPSSQPTFSQEKLEFENRVGSPGEYCYICMCWVTAAEMESHLEKVHLSDVPTDCGVFHLQTERQGQLLNTGLCPFCLGTENLTLKKRFCFFDTRRRFMKHVSLHFQSNLEERLDCPHPKCVTTHSIDDLIQHFEVVHGIDQLGHFLQSGGHSNRKGRPAAGPSKPSVEAVAEPLIPPPDDDTWLNEFLNTDLSAFVSTPSNTPLQGVFRYSSSSTDLSIETASQDPSALQYPLASDSSTEIPLQYPSPPNDIWSETIDGVNLPCKKRRKTNDIGLITKKRTGLQKGKPVTGGRRGGRGIHRKR